jgi:hypothetical protein
MRPDPLGIEGIRPAECEAISIRETGGVLANIGELRGVYARADLERFGWSDGYVLEAHRTFIDDAINTMEGASQE